MTYSSLPPEYSVDDKYPDYMNASESDLQALLDFFIPSRHCNNCGQDWTPSPAGWNSCPCSRYKDINFEIYEQALVTWCPHVQGHKPVHIVPMLAEIGKGIRFDMSNSNFMQTLAKTGIPPQALGCNITWPSMYSIVVHIDELGLGFEVAAEVGVSPIFLLYSIHRILHSRASEARALLVEYDVQDNGRIKERPKGSGETMMNLATKVLQKGRIIDSLGGKSLFVGIKRWSQNPSHARIVMI